MTRTAENHTLWGRTDPYGSYKGVPRPPPLAAKKVSLSEKIGQYQKIEVGS